jgi:hypothetical protein
MSEKCKNCKIIKWKDGTVYVGESCGDIMTRGRVIFPSG